jgi:hypothetical protein
MIRIILLLAALLLPSTVRADDRRPLPVPSTGGACPAGYSLSPTSGMCTPNPRTKVQAVPKQESRAMPDRHAREHAVVLRPRATLKRPSGSPRVYAPVFGVV